MKVFVSPHNDDEALFGAFTILREKPIVLVVFDSYIQEKRGLPITWSQRRHESMKACEELGVNVAFLGFRDDAPPEPAAIREALKCYGELYAPAWEPDGHRHHNLVAEACAGLSVKHSYLTYTTRGKSTSNNPVPVPNGSWIAAKHRALACYESQFAMDARLGCWPHFMRDMTEYYL